MKNIVNRFVGREFMENFSLGGCAIVSTLDMEEPYFNPTGLSFISVVRWQLYSDAISDGEYEDGEDPAYEYGFKAIPF